MGMNGILIWTAALAAAGLLMRRGLAEKTAVQAAPFRMHTLFAAECDNYSDWQTVGLMHSYRKARQPGPITRLLSCANEEKKSYRGMDLAPTFEVPSMGTHQETGDLYPSFNRVAGVVHWLEHSKDAENVDWVVILDVDVIIRRPIIPWELGAEKRRPVGAQYGFGGFLAIHIDDLRALAPIWLSKSEDTLKIMYWASNDTSDIHQKRWISEMCGYFLGAAEVGLSLEIKDNLVIYAGHVPQQGIQPILMHYGLPIRVGNWSFSKLEHQQDNIVYDCHRLFPRPPHLEEVKEMESKRRALFLIIECINTLNEGLLLQHAANGCPETEDSKYSRFLRSKTSAELSRQSRHIMEANRAQKQDVSAYTNPKIHTLFAADCSLYFDWQTVGLVHSFYHSGQPGGITRLLTCTNEDLKKYKGRDLVPTHYVPSMSRHPITGDWYPAINKPAAVVHWINHVKVTDIEYIVILDADMIMKGPITPWEFNASHGRPVSTPYDNLIGCDNELAKTHTRNPNLCSKVGGVIIMHIRDVRRFALLWLHKTEQVRADMENWSTNITGDAHKAGWMSQMYGYAFAAAELRFQHVISNKILIHPGTVPQHGVKYRVFHYSSPFKVGNWSFDKAKWTKSDMVNKCWSKFPNPPNPLTLKRSNESYLQRDLISIACVNSLNEALRAHHERNKCPHPSKLSPPPARRTPSSTSLPPPKRGTAGAMTTSRNNKKTPHRPSTPVKGMYLPPPEREKSNETMAFRKFGKFDDGFNVVRHDSAIRNKSRELSATLTKKANQMFSSMRFWIVGVWGFSVFVFVMVVWTILSRCGGGHKRRSKALKIKRRASQ